MSKTLVSIIALGCLLFPSTQAILAQTAPNNTLDLPFAAIGGVARADLGQDGVDELIVSAGPLESPTVAILRQDGSQIATFEAYAPGMNRGVTLAVGDVTGDGVNDIVTGTMYGAGPHVRVFSNQGELLHQFFAYAESFTGGVNITLADLNGDGVQEIVTAAGIGGGPHVRALSAHGQLVAEFFAFDVMDRSGITVAAIDTNDDRVDELAVARYGRGISEARLVSFDERNIAQLGEPIQLSVEEQFGVTLTAVSPTHVAITSNGHDTPALRWLLADGSVSDPVDIDSQEDRVLIAGTEPDARALTVLQTDPLLVERQEKHIRVDISEQRLYAYQDGVLENTFLISAGRWPFKTPTGEFSVMRKLRHHTYRWYDRAGQLLYDLPNVEYNLEFTRHYYIHHAYWHSNWGTPMSHGCVNAPYDGVKWVYEWAEVGTPVIVHE